MNLQTEPKKRAKWKKPKKWVGYGASFGDWFSGEVEDIRQSWESEDPWEKGYAIGKGIMLPFGALDKGVAYLVGGPVQGAMAQLQGQKGVDLFDYEQAQERFGSLNPAMQFGIEMVGGALVPGKVLGLAGKLAKWEKAEQTARAAARYGQAPQNVGSISKLVPTAPPGIAEKITTSGPGEAAGKAAEFVLDWGIPAFAGAGTAMHDSEDKGLGEMAVEGAIGFMGARLLGEVAKGAARRIKEHIAPERFDEVDLSSVTDPAQRERLERLRESRAIMADQRFPGSQMREPAYPGAGKRARQVIGWLAPWTDQHGVDQFLTWTVDKLQPIRTWQKRWERMTGGPLADERNIIRKAVEFPGSVKRIEKYFRQIGIDMRDLEIDLNSKRQMAHFDEWLMVKVERQRVDSGYHTDRFRADPANRAASQRMLQEDEDNLRRIIDSSFGKGTADKFDQALERINVHFDGQLTRMVNAEIITQDAADRMRAARTFYARARDIEFDEGHYPNMGGNDWLEQPKGHPTMSAGSSGVGVTHSSMERFGADLISTLEHFAWRERLIQKNEIAKALESNRVDPQWAAMMKRVLPKPDGSMPEPTKGFGIIPVLVKNTNNKIERRDYEVPDDVHKALMGLSSENADITTRFMGKFGEVFRAGVTALSIPFMFRNVPRDLEGIFLRNGFSSLNYKSYIAALYDSMTGGKFGEVYRVIEKRLGLNKFDPIKRLDEAIKSPTLWDPGDPNSRMTWLEEAMVHGGAGMGTLAEVLGKNKSVAEMLGVEGGIVIKNPLELIRASSEILELSSRLGVYRTARLAGKTAAEAGEMMRECSVDFSRSGNITRILNIWAPLLNARIQGTYRDINAFGEDPYGFALRGFLMVGLPTIATYYHNRENFGDLYDKITPEAKDSYYPIIFGNYDDRNGDVRPLYIAIPKDPAHRLISTPIEYLLDTLTHVENSGRRLPEIEDRTERSLLKMARDTLMAQSPINLNSNDMDDPQGWLHAVGKGFLQANPVAGTLAQMVSNQDWDRSNLPIKDPYEYYMNDGSWADSYESPFIDVVARAIGVNPVLKPAPSELAFLAKSMGGTAAQHFIGAGDLLVEALGIQAPRPTDWSKLVIPPGTDREKYEKIVEQMSKIDSRPWYTKAFPWWYGTAGGQQTQAAKVQQLSEEAQKKYWDTRNLWNEYERWMLDQWYPSLTEIEKKLLTGDQGTTHGVAANALFDLGKKRTAALETAKLHYKMAITDPRERKQFHEEMPGVPVRFADQGKYLQQIEGTRLAEAIRRYDSPSRIQGRSDLFQDPVVMSSARNAELNDMAREWGVDSRDLQDQILAAKRGAKLPILPIPAMWIEEAVARYKYPAGVEDLGELDSRELIMRRQMEIKDLAEQWGIGYEDLWNRVRTRLSYPEERTPMMTDWERALNLSTTVRNDAEFPDFLSTDGQPMGTPSEWQLWLSEIEEAKGKYGTDYNKWPRHIRELDDARRRGEVKRVEYLHKDPDYLYYQQWFGPGKNLSGDEWKSYLSGADGYERYKRGTIEDWNQWDYEAKLYEAAPRGSRLRLQLSARVKMHNRWMNRGWRAVMYEERAEKMEEYGAETDALFLAATGQTPNYAPQRVEQVATRVEPETDTENADELQRGLFGE
jgi:hypothetical protein